MLACLPVTWHDAPVNIQANTWLAQGPTATHALVSIQGKDLASLQSSHHALHGHCKALHTSVKPLLMQLQPGGGGAGLSSQH